jgi:NADH:ubiquinone oxidoreductase subunit K
MTFWVAALSAVCLFGLLTRRTWLGVLINLQGLISFVVVSLVVLSHSHGAAYPMPQDRAQGLGLILLIFFQLQALVALGFAVRLHHLGRRPRMEELRTMRH